MRDPEWRDREAENELVRCSAMCERVERIGVAGLPNTSRPRSFSALKPEHKATRLELVYGLRLFAEKALQTIRPKTERRGFGRTTETKKPLCFCLLKIRLIGTCVREKLSTAFMSLGKKKPTCESMTTQRGPALKCAPPVRREGVAAARLVLY
jgi:hypothetical protein